jgi:hypothetical protein
MIHRYCPHRKFPAIQPIDFFEGGLTMESARGQFAGLMA